MAKHIKLQKSESVVTAGAIQIYSAYIAAGRVPEGQEDQWMSRSIKEAIKITTSTDAAVISDDEVESTGF